MEDSGGQRHSRRVREVSRPSAKRPGSSRRCTRQIQPNNPATGDHDVRPRSALVHAHRSGLVVLTCNLLPSVTRTLTNRTTMISHTTLYNLANSLGMLAMFTVVLYHFVAVNARHLEKSAHGSSIAH